MSVAITIMPEGFKEAEKALEGVKNGFPKAMSRAINDGLVAGRTAASKLIRTRYNIKAATIKSAITLNKARAKVGELGGSLEARGPMMPVSDFAPRVRLKPAEGAPSRSRRKYQNVTVMIVKGARKLIKGAFMAKGRIWERRGPERDAKLGIVSTLGVPYMIGTLHIQPQIEQRMREVSSRSLAHEVDYELGRVAEKTNKWR
jgi:hypothetical protein